MNYEETLTSCVQTFTELWPVWYVCSHFVISLASEVLSVVFSFPFIRLYIHILILSYFFQMKAKI